jgi:hypothetical protein
MAYILIFCAHVYNGCAPASVEFADKDACEKAVVQVVNEAVKSSGGKIDYAFCTRKRGVE